MKELGIIDALASHSLACPRELARDAGIALMAEELDERNAFDVLLPRHQNFIRAYFNVLIDETYIDLRHSSFERRDLIQRIDREYGQWFVDARRRIPDEAPQEIGWAYVLVLARGWRALDLVLEAHKYKKYMDKRKVYLTQPNHYPALLELFEPPELHLSGFEAEILADICEGAGARDFKQVFGIARELVTALPQTAFAKKREHRAKRLGYGESVRLGNDFIDMLLSIRYSPS